MLISMLLFFSLILRVVKKITSKRCYLNLRCSVNINFTSTVKFLPQTLLKFLGIFPAIVHPLVLRTLHRPLRVLRVRQRREALRHRRLKWFQGPHYKVSDKASFLERLFPVLPVRRLDLEFAV